MPLCIGTSLAIIIPTSIRRRQAHRKRGSVDMDILLKWALPVLLGVILGSVIARYAPEKLFKVVFVGVAWTAAARLLLGKESWRLGDEMPKGIFMRAYGFFIGLLSTLMGIGGGLFSNLLMTFYGRPIDQAIGTSAGLAVLISISGALGYIYAGRPAAARFPEATALQLPFAIGYISLIGALLVMPTSLLVRAARRARRASDDQAQTRNGVRDLSADRLVAVRRQSRDGVLSSRRYRQQRLLRVNLRVGLAQNVLLHLAHGVARQLVDEDHALRHA